MSYRKNTNPCFLFGFPFVSTMNQCCNWPNWIYEIKSKKKQFVINCHKSLLLFNFAMSLHKNYSIHKTLQISCEYVLNCDTGVLMKK